MFVQQCYKQCSHSMHLPVSSRTACITVAAALCRGEQTLWRSSFVQAESPPGWQSQTAGQIEASAGHTNVSRPRRGKDEQAEQNGELCRLGHHGDDLRGRMRRSD